MPCSPALPGKGTASASDISVREFNNMRRRWRYVTHAEDVLHHIIYRGLYGAGGDAFLGARDQRALLPAVDELDERVGLTPLLLLLGLHQFGKEGLAGIFGRVHGVLVDNDHVGEEPVFLGRGPAMLAQPQLGLVHDRLTLPGRGALGNREEIGAEIFAHDGGALARFQEILPILTDEKAFEDRRDGDLSVIACLCLRVLVPKEAANCDQVKVGARVHAKILLEGNRAHDADGLGDVMVQLIHVLTEGCDVSGGCVLLDRVVVRGDDVASSGSRGLRLASLLPRPLRLLCCDLPDPHSTEIFYEIGKLFELERYVAVDGVVVEIYFDLRDGGGEILEEDAKDL